MGETKEQTKSLKKKDEEDDRPRSSLDDKKRADKAEDKKDDVESAKEVHTLRQSEEKHKTSAELGDGNGNNKEPLNEKPKEDSPPDDKQEKGEEKKKDSKTEKTNKSEPKIKTTEENTNKDSKKKSGDFLYDYVDTKATMPLIDNDLSGSRALTPNKDNLTVASLTVASSFHISQLSSISFPYCPRTPVMSIGFHHKQFISVSNADEDTIDRVITAMKYNYCKGVRRRAFQTQEGVRRIELYGMPFQPYFMDHFTFVNAIMLMLKDLLKAGYAVVSVANIGQGRDMFVWFFRKENFNTRKTEHKFGLLELLGRCKIRTYGTVQDYNAKFEDILTEYEQKVVETESKYNLFTSIRVGTNVWDTKRSLDTLKSKGMLSKMMQKLEEEKYQIYMAIPLDRKRSAMMYWKNLESTAPRKPGFFISLMRKNRIVLSEADEKTTETVKKALKSSWKKKVAFEDPLLSECPGAQTFILDGNPFTQGPIQKVRDVLDLMFALLKGLRFDGWTAAVNVHMITNVIDRGSIWFTYGDVCDTDFCSISVEDTAGMRAYKVPQQCIDNVNSNVLDVVLPDSQGWSVENEEYYWNFEEEIWVPSSSSEWNEEETLIEKGHAVLCAVIHGMMEQDYHPVLAMNMPPSGVADEQGQESKSKHSRNICTFFFAKDIPHYNRSIYPMKVPNAGDNSDGNF